MKIENGKIVEATEEELFGRYLHAGMDDIMSFIPTWQYVKRTALRLLIKKKT